MRLLVMLGAAVALAGCQASSQNAPNLLLAQGFMRVMPHPSDRNLVVVQSLNVLDLGGYNLDRAEDRRQIVHNLLRAQCGQPEIVDAQVTLTGSPDALRQLRTYTLTVRCPNGASSPAER
jgi:hypothetical protein